jgi:hypothetical protein
MVKNTRNWPTPEEIKVWKVASGDILFIRIPEMCAATRIRRIREIRDNVAPLLPQGVKIVIMFGVDAVEVVREGVKEV